MYKRYARCGNRCGQCLLYRPNVMEDDRREALCAAFRKIWPGYDPDPKQVICDGCTAGGPDAVLFSPACQTRKCVEEKGIPHCGWCESFPCGDFPAEPAQEELVMLIDVKHQYSWEEEALMEAYRCKRNMDEFRRQQKEQEK